MLRKFGVKVCLCVCLLLLSSKSAPTPALALLLPWREWQKTPLQVNFDLSWGKARKGRRILLSLAVQGWMVTDSTGANSESKGWAGAECGSWIEARAPPPKLSPTAPSMAGNTSQAAGLVLALCRSPGTTKNCWYSTTEKVWRAQDD